MKRTFLKVGAVAGVASVAVLAAGPAIAASVPVSQASAQSVNLTIAGNSAVSQKITATNDGTVAAPGTQSSTNTIPQLTQLLPTNSFASLGVAPQDAYANPDGTSSACASLAGQGGGIVQTGSQPCTIKGGQPVVLNTTNMTLGTLLGAQNNAALAPVTTALQALYGPTNTSVVQPLENALTNLPLRINVTLTGIGAYCEAHPGGASGGAESPANVGLSLTIGSTTTQVVNLAADGSTNQKLIGDLPGSTTMLTNAVSDALTTALTQMAGSPVGGGTQLSALNGVLTPVAGAINTITGLLGGIIPTVQNSILDPVTKALAPLTTALSQNVLEATFNQQPPGTNPVQQAPGTFDVTALDLEVLPAAKQAIGSSLISGQIGHVTCGPNTKPAVVTPSASPSSPANNAVPTKIDSGKSGGSNTTTIIAAMSVLLAAGGAAGAGAYRRYWMPRG